MTLVLREIYKHPPWYKVSVHPWLQNGEIPADPLTNLRTTVNSLSVWLVDNDRSNLERLVAALMAKRDLKEFVYLLFDHIILDQMPIRVEEKFGATPDDGINHLHRNLSDLSGRVALDLVSTILKSQYETDTMIPTEVIGYVTRSVLAGYIDYNQLSKPFKREIEARR